MLSWFGMKSFKHIILTLFFIVSAVGVNNLCLMDCEHASAVETQAIESVDNHDCCSEESVPVSNNSQDCQMENCFDLSVKKEQVIAATGAQSIEKSAQLELILLSGYSYDFSDFYTEETFIEYSPTTYRSPKIPLYVFYQKLLIS